MEVEIIKANPVIPGDACVDRSSRKRVAAYCRVSTDDEDQIKSYGRTGTHCAPSKAG